MTGSLVAGQPADGVPHIGGIGIPVHGVPPVLAHQVAQRLDVHDLVPMGPQRVHRTAVRQHEQPRAEPLGRVVARGAAPDIEKRALQHVLGLVGAHVAPQEAQQAARVRRVGLLECQLLATGQPRADRLTRVHILLFADKA